MRRWPIVLLLAGCAAPARIVADVAPLPTDEELRGHRRVVASLAGECADDQNVGGDPLEGCGQGAQWIAWQYVPGRDIEIARIELRTSSPSVALLADDGGRPGEALGVGGTPASVDDAWAAVHFDPPIAVTADRVYWVAARQQQCSLARDGSSQPYYGSFGTLAGGWEGPYQFDDRRWMARIRGRCR